MTRQAVVLVTKTSTQNQGNQALSAAWLELLKETFPQLDVGAVERMPPYLKRFRLSELRDSSDPVALFDSWASALAAMTPLAPAPGLVRSSIAYKPQAEQATRFLALRRALAIRSRLAALGAGKRDYRQRLGAFARASTLVVNPAGEFQSSATDTALAYLLDLRVAQLMGLSTAMVNLSFEISDPTLQAIAAHVMDRTVLLELRDEQSAVAYAGAGGTKEPVVLPDAAVLTEVTPPVGHETRRAGTVALAINGLQARDGDLGQQWVEVIGVLKQNGIEPTLVSNEWSTDAAFWRELQDKVDITAAGRDLNHLDYAAFLGGFEVVVSSRLHTCVLALCAGTAVVPIETGTFKLSGFFDQIGFRAAPVNLAKRSWPEEVVARISACREDADILSTQLGARDAARDALRDRLGSHLAELA